MSSRRRRGGKGSGMGGVDFSEFLRGKKPPETEPKTQDSRSTVPGRPELPKESQPDSDSKTPDPRPQDSRPDMQEEEARLDAWIKEVPYITTRDVSDPNCNKILVLDQLDVDGKPVCEIRISTERTKIGKGDPSQIQIDDDSVAELHAVIGLQDNEFKIADFRESGTIVNEEKISKSTTLNPGDVIKVGEARLKVREIQDLEQDTGHGTPDPEPVAPPPGVELPPGIEPERKDNVITFPGRPKSPAEGEPEDSKTQDPKPEIQDTEHRTLDTEPVTPPGVEEQTAEPDISSNQFDAPVDDLELGLPSFDDPDAAVSQVPSPDSVSAGPADTLTDDEWDSGVTDEWDEPPPLPGAGPKPVPDPVDLLDDHLDDVTPVDPPSVPEPESPTVADRPPTGPQEQDPRPETQEEEARLDSWINTVPHITTNVSDSNSTTTLVLDQLDADGKSVREVRFNQDIIKIGKLESSHLHIEDESVSRMHAVIEITDEAHIIDLGSEFGTIVNGTRVNRCLLRPGAVIDIGGARLKVREIVKEDSGRPTTPDSEPIAPPPGVDTQPASSRQPAAGTTEEKLEKALNAVENDLRNNTIPTASLVSARELLSSEFHTSREMAGQAVKALYRLYHNTMYSSEHVDPVGELVVQVSALRMVDNPFVDSSTSLAKNIDKNIARINLTPRTTLANLEYLCKLDGFTSEIADSTVSMLLDRDLEILEKGSTESSGRIAHLLLGMPLSSPMAGQYVKVYSALKSRFLGRKLPESAVQDAVNRLEKLSIQMNVRDDVRQWAERTAVDARKRYGLDAQARRDTMFETLPAEDIAGKTYEFRMPDRPGIIVKKKGVAIELKRAEKGSNTRRYAVFIRRGLEYCRLQSVDVPVGKEVVITDQQTGKRVRLCNQHEKHGTMEQIILPKKNTTFRDSVAALLMHGGVAIGVMYSGALKYVTENVNKQIAILATYLTVMTGMILYEVLKQKGDKK